MNLEDFIEVFKESRTALAWKVKNDLIRATEPETNLEMCPMTGVYFFCSRKLINKMDFHKAALALNMDLRLANSIAMAADDSCCAEEIMKIRKRLIAEINK